MQLVTNAAEGNEGQRLQREDSAIAVMFLALPHEGYKTSVNNNA